KEKEKKKSIPIGITDFGDMINEEYYYVDKTKLIEDLLENKQKVTVFTRPRWFGKTLNLSMLSWFFDIRKAPRSKGLFQGLYIENSPYFSELGKYPTLTVTFRDSKALTPEKAVRNIYRIVFDLLNKMSYVYERLSPGSKKIYDSLFESSESIFLDNALKYLSQFLYEYYNQKVVILIDEYDAPIITAFENGYFEEAGEFFRNLYCSAIKNNEYLHFGVLAGAMRVSREDIFSGMPNLQANSILHRGFEGNFGFTEEEVHQALKYYELLEFADDVREWYDGYHFGDETVYNPWMVLNYLKAECLEPYWISAADNFIVNTMLDLSDYRHFRKAVPLFGGIGFRYAIDKHKNFDKLIRQNDIWSLLLYSGYLTAEGNPGDSAWLLKIPNKELTSFFEDAFLDKLGGIEKCEFQRFVTALENGRIMGYRSFSYYLQEFFLSHSKAAAGCKESFYHAFMLVLILSLRNDYTCYSEDEQSLGRVDVILEPKDKKKPAYIFGFKVAESKNDMDIVLELAFAQLDSKEYKEKLTAKGIKKILAVGITCYDNEIKVKHKTL
ncbi:MAG: ATP-binding protein, partial [Fusobacteriaceae bacterium]|nr:ATP-binding protein [Fusobacteriaceae bacterium]